MVRTLQVLISMRTPEALRRGVKMDGMNDASELVSTGRAAQLLGIDRSTLTRWAASGLVAPASRTVGGHMRWNPDALRDQIAALQSHETADGE